MMALVILLVSATVPGMIQAGFAQSEQALDMELEVSDVERTIILAGFAVAVAGVFLYLARDVILRKKTSYDSEDLESKKEKTYEKYHSDWGDDYEEIGARSNTGMDKEFLSAAASGDLPDYYGVIGVAPDASPDEIKKKFRTLAKKTHPDKAGSGYEDVMAKINEAYEVLSDRDNRDKYDRYRKSG